MLAQLKPFGPRIESRPWVNRAVFYERRLATPPQPPVGILDRLQRGAGRH